MDVSSCFQKAESQVWKATLFCASRELRRGSAAPLWGDGDDGGALAGAGPGCAGAPRSGRGSSGLRANRVERRRCAAHRAVQRRRWWARWRVQGAGWRHRPGRRVRMRLARLTEGA